MTEKKPTLVALVGMQHRGTEDLVAGMLTGETLTLIREPNNPADRNAIQVWARGLHIGFIKGSQAPPVALAMDSTGGAPWVAKLAHKEGKWPMVEIE